MDMFWREEHYLYYELGIMNFGLGIMSDELLQSTCV